MALPKLGCEKCEYRGYFVGDDKEIVTCECMLRKRRIAVYEGIGIPRALFDAKIEDFQIKNTGHGAKAKDLPVADSKLKERAKTVVQSYMDQMGNVFQTDADFSFGGPDDPWSGRTIALCGKHGSGKSLLAVCIAKQAVKLGIAPKIIQWADVIEACYDFDYGNDDNAFNAMADILARAKPIIIENFSMNYETRKFPTDAKETGGLNPVTRRRIDSLFSPVYQKGLPLVLTTSHTASELNTTDAYGPLMSSVLSDAFKIPLPSLKIESDYNVMK